MPNRRPFLAAALLLPGLARAQAPEPWPSRPIRILLAYPPGGSTDVLARALAERLTAAFPGASFVVENRPGGGAVPGTLAAAQAAPDGTTLALGNNQTHAANAAMLRDLPYRPVEDFTPIFRLAEVHHALVVPASSPAKTLAELAARGRAQGLTYASSGVGSASHVIAESFVRREGLKATHVPYRGGAQAVTDTVAGVVDAFVSTWPQVVTLVQDGRLRCLGIGAPARLPELPEIPTFAEAGAPYMAVDAWFGLFGPARLPQAVVEKLAAVLPGLLAAPEMVQRLATLGFTPAPMGPTEFAAFQKAELARWAALVELTGIRIDG
ncbi:tripartite tricarboxylate transporter substrate binding protein [Siccirubricoccus sp. KC 17139]|uniref:Tripartite tricarboxylate transporter substrate binding protein n=1 Tax=Siccirubricoccus soli TaxID=2899147 RepID=A0ABT1D852_9PROT|nr:tripartite tricarboxylate transporter substrate binding protein [Siccirubricoccus soli]MCO6418054.1 tripartite tricarboxylate transporter substrate binding protein [Siccirubricoccus soli]MCP2684189.1 tripartite tricarboxylate transporter substrate binding protein [Siccirubricoccus soli]